MSATQTLMVDTIMGKKKVKAPKGWTFDQTAITVWCWLLNYTYERRQPLKLQREGRELDAKIHALSIVLANSVGMAPPYWEQAAREIA